MRKFKYTFTIGCSHISTVSWHTVMLLEQYAKENGLKFIFKNAKNF